MRPTRDDGMLTTADAARMLGVQPWLIRKWRSRGWLATQGLDERGRPLHTPEALRAAERRVTANGIAASGTSPRQLRGRARRAEAA
jgi:uncharacterized protein YjcR